MNNQIDKNHDQKRRFLRGTGICLLAVGIILLIAGISDFFTAFNNPFGGGFTQFQTSDGGTYSIGVGPKRFWLFFAAIPLIAVGSAMTKFGFSGAIARYKAEEIAPVGKDTFNYLAQSTGEGIKNIAKSIHEATDDDKGSTVLCPECGKGNPAGSVFCNGCGSHLMAPCPSCGHENVPGSQFCNKCGSKMGE